MHCAFVVSACNNGYFVQDKNIQQCFFTASALYVVCFKITEGLKGVVELEGWLLAIKVSHSKQICSKGWTLIVFDDLEKIYNVFFASCFFQYHDNLTLSYIICLLHTYLP